MFDKGVDLHRELKKCTNCKLSANFFITPYEGKDLASACDTAADANADLFTLHTLTAAPTCLTIWRYFNDSQK